MFEKKPQDLVVGGRGVQGKRVIQLGLGYVILPNISALKPNPLSYSNVVVTP